MRALLALVASTSVANAGRPCPPDEECPPQAIKLIHPVFAWHLGLRGGPSIGVVYDFKQGDDDDGSAHDPATRRLVVGWQARGDLFGAPGRLANNVIELLYGLHIRWRPGTFELVPSLEAAARVATPFGIPGLAIGLPISLRDRTQVGAGLYVHMHLLVVDYFLGIELYPSSDNLSRGVIGLQLTL